jgi:hypothetical protein
MPILIYEMLAEIEPSSTDGASAPDDTASGASDGVPATAAERELLGTLALLRERQERLRVD